MVAVSGPDLYRSTPEPGASEWPKASLHGQGAAEAFQDIGATPRHAQVRAGTLYLTVFHAR